MNTQNGTTTAALINSEGRQAASVENQLALSTSSLSLELFADPQGSNLVSAYSRELHARYGISEVCALAINLTVLSGAIGPTRTIKNPLGGVLPSALNLMVCCPANTAVRRAAKIAMAQFQAKIDEKIRAHHEKGSKHRRRVRMELEQACEGAMANLQHPPELPRHPYSGPLPREEADKQNLTAALETAEQVGRVMQEFEVEEHPWLLSDGLSLREIRDWQKSSFDRGIFNLSPDGNALHILKTRRSDEQCMILRFLKSAWHGESFIMGSETLPDPVVSNLWMLGGGEIARALQEMRASGLSETFLLADPLDTFTELTAESLTASSQTAQQWQALIQKVWDARVTQERTRHNLTGVALNLFTDFCNETNKRVQDLPKHLQGFAVTWPDQLLKIALLLHTASKQAQVPSLDPYTIEQAVLLMKHLGDEQLRIADAAKLSSPCSLDAEIEVMVAKIRLHGPLSKRDVFRRYNHQSYERLEPVLAECIERELIRRDGDLLYPAQTTVDQNHDEAGSPTGLVSVSASVQP